MRPVPERSRAPSRQPLRMSIRQRQLIPELSLSTDLSFRYASASIISELTLYHNSIDNYITMPQPGMSILWTGRIRVCNFSGQSG